MSISPTAEGVTTFPPRMTRSSIHTPFIVSPASGKLANLEPRRNRAQRTAKRPSNFPCNLYSVLRNLTAGGNMRALDDVRILDLTHVYNGPYATLLLGFLGAEIIKVEPTRKGEMARTIFKVPNHDESYPFI